MRSSPHNSLGQLTMEFMTYVGIVLSIVLLASYSAMNTGNDVKNSNSLTDARRIASAVAQEINSAVEIGDGYFHSFSLPALLNTAENYTINASDGGFVTVDWSEGTYSLPVLANSVSGSVKKGKNMIKNTGGVITFE